MFEKEMIQLQKLYKNGLYEPKFYSDKVKSIDMFSNYEELKKIPFTYKQELRDTPVCERTTTKMEDIYGVFSSSGTTGEKTFYIYNKNDKKVHEEFVKTLFSEVGVTEKDLGAVMLPVDTGVKAHTMMWQFTTMGAGYINCPEPTPKNIIEFITKVPVTTIATSPNIASGIIYDEEMKKTAYNSNVDKLLMGGGFLSEQRRKLLEKTWNANCYNMLGMSEMFGPLAGECKRKNGMHFLNKYIMIEIINPETLEPVKNDEVGVAVYTTLWEKGFPLLRYWTEDVLKITYEKCKCGSENPRVFYQGRLSEYIKIGEKYIFPENLENILFENGYIRDYCLIKNSNEIKIKIESDKKSLKESLVSDINNLFEKKIKIEIVPIKSLKYKGIGKRFIVEN